MIGLLALVVFGTSAIRSPRELSAEKFVLNDAYGRPRAKLELRELGPALSLLDRDGRDQVLLRSGEDGSSSLEYFQGVDLRASLAHFVNRGPSLNLFEAARRGRAEMFVKPDGGSGIALHRYQWGAGLNMAPDGTAKLKFLDQKGEEQNGLAIAPDGTTSALGKPEPEAIGLSDYPPIHEEPADEAGEVCEPEPSESAVRTSLPAGAPFSGRAFGAP